MPFKRLLKCTYNLHFNMKNYTTMKNYLIVVLAVLGLTACKESKVEPQSIIRHKKRHPWRMSVGGIWGSHREQSEQIAANKVSKNPHGEPAYPPRRLCLYFCI